jgi:hypothetical protein
MTFTLTTVLDFSPDYSFNDTIFPSQNGLGDAGDTGDTDT